MVGLLDGGLGGLQDGLEMGDFGGDLFLAIKGGGELVVSLEAVVASVVEEVEML